MGTALMLPVAQTEAAKALIEPKRIDAFRLAMPSERRGDWESLLATYIIAANELTKPCTPISVAKSVYNGVRLGLACGKPLNHAYLVPFKNQCQLIIGYEGYIELAYASKFITAITCQLRLEGEQFRHFVDIRGEQIEHDITDRDIEPERANIVGAYCMWETSGGGRGLWAVNRKQIDKVDTGRDVWQSNFPSMCLKTAIRRAAKLWKKTPMLAAALHLDEQAERGESQDAPDFSETPSTPENSYSLNDLEDIEESARKMEAANSHK